MGIKDLLRFMKPYIHPIHIKKYAGQRVGIDAYSWLHKGAYSCSMELCLDTEGKKKLKYIDYFMHRINLLHHYKIIPVVVFDGGSIPCKAATENDRQRRRKANYELAMEKLKEGNVRAATELFQRAISVTPSMAHQLIQVLKSEKVEFIVAPYEADAQLAYLSSLDLEEGGIAAVITEDSDLLAYGCNAVVFKMDRFGNGEELVLDNVFQAVDKKPSFQNFDRNLFAGMCILAGCDFLPSIHGIGIVKAHSFVSKYRNLERVLSVLKIEKGNLVSEDYSKSFMEAIAVFQHARVYDRDAKKLKYMKPLSKNLLDLPNGELDFLGPDLPPSVAAAIAIGNVDPISMEAFNHFPDSRSPWNPRVQSRERFQKQEKNSSLLHSFSEKQRSEEDETLIDSGPVQNDIRCSKQDSELHKLILQPNDHLTTATVDAHSKSPLKIPNNNPFKRKAEQIQLERKKSAAEELKVSFGAKDEELEVRFLVPQESMSSPQSTEDFSLKVKDMKESITESIQIDISGIEQCSEVERETKGPEIADGIVVFQGRLMSCTTRVRGVKGTSKNGKVKANCKGSENKKRSSILDFFHRL